MIGSGTRFACHVGVAGRGVGEDVSVGIGVGGARVGVGVACGESLAPTQPIARLRRIRVKMRHIYVASLKTERTFL